MRAILKSEVCEFTNPIYSSITFGLFPAASITVGLLIFIGMFISPGHNV
jgi:hypothetical protein